MSVRTTISCDYSDDVIAWCAGEAFRSDGTTEEVRKQARKAGWRFRGGKDYHGSHFDKKGKSNG